MTSYHLMLHEDLRAQINGLAAARNENPNSDQAKEYVAVIKALKALRDGRERVRGQAVGLWPELARPP
jgi:hypothetical protein